MEKYDLSDKRKQNGTVSLESVFISSWVLEKSVAHSIAPVTPPDGVVETVPAPRIIRPWFSNMALDLCENLVGNLLLKHFKMPGLVGSL